MIEQSGLTPMQKEEVCSEAGRYGVYCHYLELEASKANYPFHEYDGFIEIFSFCFALLATHSHNSDLLARVPTIGITCFDKRVVCDENEVLYHFPPSLHNKMEDILDMSLLYVALEFGLTKGESELAHLPFLFSIKEEIRPYVEAGYYLRPGSEEMANEVKEDIASRLPENLYESLEKVRLQFEEIREYLVRAEG